MISIPVMSDETVVRYHSSRNNGCGSAENGRDFTEEVAADRGDGGEAAIAVDVPSTQQSCDGELLGNSLASTLRSRDVSAAAVQYSAAVPCSCSILDIDVRPALISAPVEVAPPEMHLLAQLCALALQYRCELSQDIDQHVRSIFHSIRVPSISLWDYVRRFAKYSWCSEECFILAIVMMDRYACKTKTPITIRNAHRLYVTAMTLSVKLRDDIYYSNAYYASIGGVSNAELNLLELELLDIMQWFTWVEKSLYDAYVVRLEELFGAALPKRVEG